MASLVLLVVNNRQPNQLFCQAIIQQSFSILPNILHHLLPRRFSSTFFNTPYLHILVVFVTVPYFFVLCQFMRHPKIEPFFVVNTFQMVWTVWRWMFLLNFRNKFTKFFSQNRNSQNGNDRVLFIPSVSITPLDRVQYIFLGLLAFVPLS